MKKNKRPSTVSRGELFEAYFLGAVGAVKGVHEVYVKPEPKTSRAGLYGWLAIGAGVAVFDAKCPQGQTLSEACDRALDKHPLLTLGAIALTSAHLANVFDRFGIEQFDPLHQVAELVRKASGS